MHGSNLISILYRSDEDFYESTERRTVESRCIMAAKSLCHLQLILCRVFIYILLVLFNLKVKIKDGDMYVNYFVWEKLI